MEIYTLSILFVYSYIQGLMLKLPFHWSPSVSITEYNHPKTFAIPIESLFYSVAPKFEINLS